MSPAWPHLGNVGVGRNPLDGLVTDALASVPRGRTQDGTWRPDQPFLGDGLKITLRAAHGVTDPKVLKVPLRFQAPVTEDFSRAFSHPWSTYDTLRAGQRSRPMGAELLSIPVATLLMDGAAQDTTTGVVVWPFAPYPQRILDELRYIAGMGPAGKRGVATPFRLTINQPAVWGDAPLVNILAVVTAITATERAGSIGTEYLDVTFLEFAEDEVARRRQPTAAQRIRYHDLKPGDTLHKLAVRYYHQASAWRELRDANGIKGVRASSAEELAAWAKKHHKKRLKIPPFTDTVGEKRAA